MIIEEAIENLNKKGIYTLENTLNGKKYIGSTAKSFLTRLKQHQSKLKTQKHHYTHLQNAWDLYGESIFKFSIIEIISDNTIIRDREKYWIEFYNSYKEGYNNNPNPLSSPMLNDTSQNKVSTSLKLWWKNKKESSTPEEYKEFCLKKSSHTPWNKGIKMSEEQIKNFHKKKTVTQAVKDVHKRNSQLMKDRSPYVCVYDKDHKWLNTFWCLADVVQYAQSEYCTLPIINRNHSRVISNFLDSSKISNAMTKDVLYKGLYFKRVPKDRKLPCANGVNSWKAEAEPIMSQAESTLSEGAETTGEV